MVIQILVIQNSVFRIRINFPSFFDSFVTSTRFFHDPFELRSLNKKPQIFDLPSFIFLLQFLSNLRSCSNKKALIYYECFSFLSDLDRIQTCNLLSRNQMRYSVAPRGLFCGCKYSIFINFEPNYFFEFSK